MTKRNGAERFTLPKDLDTTGTVRVSRATLAEMMRTADTALNGDSNDAEHDALFDLREQISDLFEGAS